MSVYPVLHPMLPTIKDVAKTAATKAATAIVNYAISSVGSKKSDAEITKEVAVKALEEMGHTSRTAIEAIERVATSQKPAVRAFVAPIGESCNSARIGDPSMGALTVDSAMRQAIEAPEDIEVRDIAEYEVLISEFDFRNRSCKFALRDQENSNDRFVGEITDPVGLLPNNPYSSALDNQRWLRVRAKAQLKAGELEKLYISDLAAPALAPPR